MLAAASLNLDVDIHQRNRGGRHSRNTRRLADGPRTYFRQLLLHFAREPADRVIVEPLGDGMLLGFLQPFHRALLLHEGRRLLVGPNGATIGRSRQADIVIDDPNVSRQHAEVRPRGGAWVLTDLGSTNGSRLNGRQITGSEVIQAGDEIEIGTSVITFELE